MNCIIAVPEMESDSKVESFPIIFHSANHVVTSGVAKLCCHWSTDSDSEMFFSRQKCYISYIQAGLQYMDTKQKITYINNKDQRNNRVE